MKSLAEIRAEIASYSYADYVRVLNAVSPQLEDLPKLRIAILRSYTLDAMVPVLRLKLLTEGYDAEIWIGQYNLYPQEILDSNSGLHTFRPDIVLLMVRIEDLLPEFIDGFGDHSEQQWRELLLARCDFLGELAERIQRTLGARVLIQGAALVASRFWGAFDAQLEGGQACLAAVFNSRLAGIVESIAGAHVWDFQRFVEEHGRTQLVDLKNWFVARSPIRQSMYPAMVNDLTPALLSMLGRNAKCIVLDLDNTLWGGVIGEDGVQGIALGQDYPGNCYRAFQLEILKLSKRGILLAINSKNNERDAFEIIDSHPEMILRRQHFAAWRINWDDKAKNMRSIADELNIGVDSMMMVDDSPVECERIRQAIPECAVICLPPKPYELPRIAQVLPGTVRMAVNNDDKARNQMYQAQRIRKLESEKSGNLEEFLASLRIVVEIRTVDALSIQRVAQLTQKTNQLNLTTRRYSESEVAAMTADANTEVYAVSASDKFGDNGVVGVLILRMDGRLCVIDDLLLSCRVIGRGIEDVMVAFAAERAHARGTQRLIGEYIATPKNAPAKELLERCGLSGDGTGSRFEAVLATWTAAAPSHIRVVKQ